MVASHHRRFLLSDSPFTFEIREIKPARSKTNDEKHPAGPGKYAFKKPVADLSEQLAHEAEKKSATWMELFFDLAFVANITIFTHQHPIINATTMFRYCGWFTIMWWMWLSQTIQAGFAGNGYHFASSNSNGFALSYAVMKLVLVGQYFIVWIHAPNSRCRRPILLYMLANFISFVMWWTSAFLVEALSNQARYSIWFSAIGIEVLATIVLTNNATVTFIGSHLPERLGLFTLIILGESVMGIFMVTDDLVDAPRKLGWDNLTMLIFSITIVKCQWFLYFDDYHEQGPHRSSIHSALWTYLHFMLNLSQLLLGVGCLDLIRIYQLTKSSTDASIMTPGHHAYGAHYPGGAPRVGGIPVSERASTSSFGPNSFDEGPTEDRVLIYVKKYYLIVAASVFFWNATIKFVTSRPGDKYDRAIYLSRFFMSFIVILGHDLLVLYYAARKDMNVQHHSSQ
ncbi:hypothetical protein BGZ79_010337 [Entomortierella chlamydospora]|nr:hypothetical protein BGZ79_010337 [Entomortierella chlamydospora]